jgi:hypothetical protein
MDNNSDPVKTFNSSIKFLAKIYAIKKKGTFDEEKVFRDNKRLFLLCSSEPLYLISGFGPYFLKYNSIIKSHDWSKISKLTFTEEKKNYNGPNSSMVGEYIKILKKILINANVSEQKIFIKHLCILVDSYCDYIKNSD